MMHEPICSPMSGALHNGQQVADQLSSSEIRPYEI